MLFITSARAQKYTSPPRTQGDVTDKVAEVPQKYGASHKCLCVRACVYLCVCARETKRITHTPASYLTLVEKDKGIDTPPEKVGFGGGAIPSFKRVCLSSGDSARLENRKKSASEAVGLAGDWKSLLSLVLLLGRPKVWSGAPFRRSPGLDLTFSCQP